MVSKFAEGVPDKRHTATTNNIFVMFVFVSILLTDSLNIGLGYKPTTSDRKTVALKANRLAVCLDARMGLIDILYLDAQRF